MRSGPTTTAMLVLLILALCESSLQKQIHSTESALQPDIYSLHITSDIQYRYAHTLVRSKILNPASTSKEVRFSMVLPDTAFISGFLMEVDDNVYNAYVKEKEEASRVYKEAVRRGKTAGHIALNARDSNRFTVSVNLEPNKKVTFNMTYEELLSRKLGVYRHVINLDPGQIVSDLRVEVRIEESGSITTLDVPEIQLNDEIEANPKSGVSNPLARIERPNLHSVSIKFAPTPDQQKDRHRRGIRGQFIVQYDLGRSSLRPSQILINDGYFAHYFASDHLKPLIKHVVFVLDISTSMSGMKLAQMKKAMSIILDDLRPLDHFSFICFETSVKVWSLFKWKNASVETFQRKDLVISAASHNIQRAKNAIQDLLALGGTNIHEAMEVSVHVSVLGKELMASRSEGSEVFNRINRLEPIIFFLTDGRPTEGITQTDIIIRDTTIRNRVSKASIFCLGFGEDVDFDFLKKLALRNSGFALKVYDAPDAALQLRDFYIQVACPLVANVSFNYDPNQIDAISLTKNHFASYASGSELVVSGHLKKTTRYQNLNYGVMGQISNGLMHFEQEEPIIVIDHGKKPSLMERLWAYLSIRQLLDEEKRSDGKDSREKKQRAIQLALKYSFVTPVTSLVVVQPDGDNIRADTERADKGQTSGGAFVSNDPDYSDDSYGESEERNILRVIKKRKRNWLGHWLRRNCLLKDALEGMVKGKNVQG